MFSFLLFSCGNDYLLNHNTEEVVINEIVEEVIVYEDTSPDYTDIWVDSFIQPYATSGVDILWVIDPSGSMSDDQPRILAGITHMMSNLPSIGWRLMIIPSDFQRVTNIQSFPIVPGDTITDVEAMYNANMHGHREAGFDAVYEYVAINTYANTWLRNDAALLIVFVSDENEQSSEYFSSYIEFYTWLRSYRMNSAISSIVHIPPTDSLCNVSPINTGQEYIDITNLYYGQVLDICSEDWSSGVADAALQVTPYEEWELSRVPLDTSYIYVFIDNIPTFDWVYDTALNKVVFNVIPPDGSLVEIAYNVQ